MPLGPRMSERLSAAEEAELRALVTLAGEDATVGVDRLARLLATLDTARSGPASGGGLDVTPEQREEPLSAERKADRRRTCWCSHRFGAHSKGGQCLAVVNDPDRSALVPCPCHGWEPR
jgi:hypothetical protein